MCVDYTDLNNLCPKDSYLLSNIDHLVDKALGFRMLSFRDAFSGYNQVKMHLEDEDKTTFITNKGVYCYKVMPLGLKNTGETYQRMKIRYFLNRSERTWKYIWMTF